MKLTKNNLSICLGIFITFVLGTPVIIAIDAIHTFITPIVDGVIDWFKFLKKLALEDLDK